MTCPDCGRDNEAGAGACAACGSPLLANDAPTLDAAPPPGPAAPGARWAAEAARRLAPGSRLGERYEIVSILGEGGMGMVYKALDRALGRTVALKVIRPEMASRPEILERFKREIVLASRVTHRNVLRIHDLGEAEGVRFLSMTYVEGTNLKALLAREGPLALDRALPLVRQIAEALQAAHEAGIVHRDLKPQNILIDREGNAYIADFGISRSLESGATMTETGAVVGTVDYMSPEQARGETPDHRGDIYSLGMILYEIFTGALPFRSPNPLSVMMKRVHEEAPAARRARPDLPPWMSAIIARALQRDPAARYQSVAELLRDLERRRASIAWRRLLWRRVPAAIAAGLLLAAAVAGVFRLVRSRPSAVTVPRTSLALLPFTNATGDPRDDWARSGLVGLLRSGLIQTRTLRLVDEGRVQEVLDGLKITQQDLGRKETLQRIGNLIGVDNVLSGTLMRAGDRFRIEASVAPVGPSSVAPATPIRVEGKGEDALFDMVDELTRLIRNHLGLSRRWGEADRAGAELSTRSVDALRLYTQGRALARAGNLIGAAQQVESALEKDPKFAVARAFLAETYDRLGRSNRAATEAEKAAQDAGPVSSYEAVRIRAVKARLTHDLEGAETAYRTLSEISPNDPETLFDLASTEEQKGDLPQALETLRRVLALDPKHPDAHYALGRVQVKLGNPGEGLKEYNIALGYDVESGNEEGRATVLNGIGNAYHHLGQYDEALRDFQQSLQIRRRINDQRGMRVALNNIAMILVIQGRYDEAIKAGQEALEASQAIGDQEGLAETYASLGDTNQAAGRPHEALSAYQESLRIVRETGNETLLAKNMSSIGYVDTVLGSYLEAFFFMKDALAKRREIGDKVEVLRSLIDIGVVEQIQGRYEEALKYYLEALPLAQAAAQRAGVVVLSANLATIHEDQGEYGAALELLTEAERQAREIGDKDLTATCLVYLGSVRQRLGDLDGADSALGEALRLAREVDNAPLIAEALIDQGETLLARRRSVQAAGLLRDAVTKARAAEDRRLLLLARLRKAEATQSSRDLEAALRDVDASGLAPLVAPIRLALGRISLSAGRTSEAEHHAGKAIVAGTPLKQRDLLLQAHAIAGRSLDVQGREAAAADHYLAGLSLLEEIREGLKDAPLRRFLSRPDLVLFGRDAQTLFQRVNRASDADRARRDVAAPQAAAGAPSGPPHGE